MIHNVGADGKSSCRFVESFGLTGESGTGSRVHEVLSEARKLAKDRFGTDVYCTVTDNAVNMIKMSSLGNSWRTGCNSHSGNLLFNDLLRLPEFNKAAMRTTAVLQFFKHADRMRSLEKFG